MTFSPKSCQVSKGVKAVGKSATSSLEDSVKSQRSPEQRLIVLPQRGFLGVGAGLSVALSAPPICSLQLWGEDDSIGHITLHGAY